MARRGPYRALTLKEKLDAIGDIERGVKLTDVTTKFGVFKKHPVDDCKGEEPIAPGGGGLHTKPKASTKRKLP